jgi:hypothetical protein
MGRVSDFRASLNDIPFRQWILILGVALHSSIDQIKGDRHPRNWPGVSRVVVLVRILQAVRQPRIPARLEKEVLRGTVRVAGAGQDYEYIDQFKLSTCIVCSSLPPPLHKGGGTPLSVSLDHLTFSTASPLAAQAARVG